MFLKQAYKAVAIVLKFAPAEASLKIAQRVLMATLTPLAIYFTQRLIDASVLYIGGNAGGQAVVLWCGLLLFTMFFRTTDSFFDGITGISVSRKLNAKFTPVIVEKFRKLDYANFEDKDTQDTIKRMSNEPQRFLQGTYTSALACTSLFVVIVISSLIFAQVSVWFMLGFILLIFPMVWFDFKSQSISHKLWYEQSSEERRLDYLGGLLSGKEPALELKIFGASGYISDKWRKKSETVLNERLKTAIYAQRFAFASTLLFKAWTVFLVIYLVNAVIAQNISIGLFTALITSIATVIHATENLSRLLQYAKRATLLIDHYDIFLKMGEMPENSGGENLASPRIAFENVTFRYPKTDRTILNGISFEIGAGERVSLVGENGAGKSTVIKLLCRLYRPDSGRILINGIDINDLSNKQLCGVFSVVFQDFCNYSLTLRENVAFGDLSKMDCNEELESALKQGLWVNDDIGLDTPLGKLEEGGVDLSGGQWQRVAIARACLAPSAFVILDEPAASLDPVAESEMYKSFSEVLRSRGCIMISHRLASAKMADKIIVIGEGVVKEQGSHTQLMENGGLYAEMFSAQSAWYV
ncbi:MAG: ABC transporter ATP-binding protein/permease [Oscillospiraceae bacterium]|jgi:ABC-type multidrug transport system fused ATPase/permease subunit|nr:ABC transporter ATP-binding protein/permease [Oscillospiraceae bacterium]